MTSEDNNKYISFDNNDIEVLAMPEDRGSYLSKRQNGDFLPASRTHDLTTYDALKAYISKIRQYPRLSKEEELELLRAYREDNNLEAAYKLISANLWLVVKIAKNYENIARNLLDIIQEGNIGLMEAVKNFNPNKGANFPSYAVLWIKAYIIRYIMANIRLVKIGTTQAQRKLFFNLQKEKSKLEKEGFYPSTKLLAERLNVKEQDVIEMDKRLYQKDLSLDAPISDESQESYLNIIPAKDKTAEEILAQRQINDLIVLSFNKFKSTLNEKEVMIFKERLLKQEKATLKLYVSK